MVERYGGLVLPEQTELLSALTLHGQTRENWCPGPADRVLVRLVQLGLSLLSPA